MPSPSASPVRTLCPWVSAALGLALGCATDELPPPAIDSAHGSSAAGDTGDVTGTTTASASGSDETAPDPSANPLDGIGPVELVADGFVRVEGPVWRAETGDLLFTDVSADTIHRLVPPDAIEVFRGPTRPPTFANGLALDGDGRLVACEHATQRVTRGNMAEEIIANLWMGSRLNSPNDLVVHPNGDVLFTDPTYGTAPELGGVMLELDFQGVYLAPSGGGLELLYGGFAQPNGIVLSPAADVLYVADTEQGMVFTIPLDETGRPTDIPSLFTDQAPDADGLEVDAAGNLYVATPSGVLVLDSTGTAWGGIEIPEPTDNMEFGGPDLHTLYVAATTGLYRVELAVAGLP